MNNLKWLSVDTRCAPNGFEQQMSISQREINRKNNGCKEARIVLYPHINEEFQGNKYQSAKIQIENWIVSLDVSEWFFMSL